MRTLGRWLLWWGFALTLSLLLFHGCFFDPPNLAGFACQNKDECLGSLDCVQGRCRIPCAQSQDCKDTSNCVSGYCALPNADGSSPDLCLSQEEKCNGKDDDCDGQIDEGLRCAKEGDICDLSLDNPIACSAGLRCTSFSPDRPRVCRKECDASNPNSCNDSKLTCLRIGGSGACFRKECSEDTDCNVYRTPHVCVSTGGSTRFCLAVYKEGTLNQGEVCNPDKGLFCKSPASCMRRDNESQGICSSRCSSDSDCKTQNGTQVCRTLQGNYNICRDSCEKDSQSCPNGTTCDASSKICVPKF